MNWIHADIHRLSEEEYAAVYHTMSSSRQQRVDRKANQPDKQRTLLGEYLAKQMVAAFCGLSPAEVVIDTDDKGKPFARDLDVHVSIAHCGQWVVCAVDKHPLGIDIERIKPVRLALIKRVCVEEEWRYIFGEQAFPDGYCEDPAFLTRFYEVWTAKEAYFKQMGTGITHFKSVNILTLNRQIHHLPEHLVQIVYR